MFALKCCSPPEAARTCFETSEVFSTAEFKTAEWNLLAEFKTAGVFSMVG